MLSKEIMTTLGGRYIPVEVYPFSFKEYLRSRNIPYDEQTLMGTTGKSLFLREYAEYMNWGGLPESVKQPLSYSIEGSDATEKREVEALQKLPKALPCKRRVIITYDEEKTIEDEYGLIEVIPCWKWLIFSPTL